MRNVTVCVPAFGVLLWELATQGMSLCFSLWCVAMGTGNTGHVTVFQPLVCCNGNWQGVECHCVSSVFGALLCLGELATCGMSPFVFQLLMCCYGNWLHVECHHLCSSF